MRLPLEWAGRVEPAPGHVYLVRQEQPTLYKGLIFLTENIRQGKKSQLAKVVRVGMGVDPRFLDETVLVAAGVGRRLVFGDRDDVCYDVCRPEELIAIFSEDADVDKTDQRTAAGRYRHQQPELDGKNETGTIKRPVP